MGTVCSPSQIKSPSITIYSPLLSPTLLAMRKFKFTKVKPVVQCYTAGKGRVQITFWSV